jgi:hypothetical protein
LVVLVEENLVVIFFQPAIDLPRPADVGTGVTEEDVRHDDYLPRLEYPPQ